MGLAKTPSFSPFVIFAAAPGRPFFLSSVRARLLLFLCQLCLSAEFFLVEAWLFPFYFLVPFLVVLLFFLFSVFVSFPLRSVSAP